MKEKTETRLLWICIALLAISIFINNNTVMNIISLIILIFFGYTFLKKPKEKINLPKNKEFYSKKKNIVLLIISLLSIIAIEELLLLLGLSENIEYLLYCIIVLVILFIIYHKELIHSFKLLKNNFSKYLKYIVNSQFIIIVIYLIAVIIETLLLNGRSGVSANQAELNNVPYVMLFFTSVFCAPFIEEIIFRYSIKKFIKNKYIYILVVALIFGSMHIVAEKTIIDALIYGIPYFTFGGLLAYFYYKSDNIYCTIANHMIHNLLVLILMLFI